MVNNMSLTLTIIILVIAYIVICAILSYTFENVPVWLEFLMLPANIIGFIILFPFILIERKKCKEELLEESENDTKHNINNKYV